jgi:hypothetical protein
MGYHNSSNDGTYSYDYKNNNKGGYKRMHGKSVTANTSPMSSNQRHAGTKKHMQSLNKNDIGFSHSQHVSPTISQSNKFYQSKGKSSLPTSTSYALAQIGKKTYVIPTSTAKNTEPSSKNSSKGSNKGKTAYYDALGYGKYSISGSKKSKKRDSVNFQNRLNLKMINDYEEKKAFSLVSSISNKKDIGDPINIRAMEHLHLNKESPLGIRDEQDLRALMQQNKLIKGFNLDNLIMDGGTGGGNSKRVNNYLKNKPSKQSNSESGKIKGKNSIYSNKQSKKSSTKGKITKYFGGSRKNSKYKALDMTNITKQECNKGYNTYKKKYSNANANASELRRKTNSVEPPDNKDVTSPGNQVAYHRHHKSVNNAKNNNVGTTKNKSKPYGNSQGNSELKQNLDKAKGKGRGKGLRSLHRSDINSLDRDDSSEYEIIRDNGHPMISKEMNIPAELYNSYKRQNLISSALDTPISKFSKETSPQFVVHKNKKIRTSSLVGKGSRANSSKESKKRASSSNAANRRHYLPASNNLNLANSHDVSGQLAENYSMQKYYEMYSNGNHNKSAQPNAPKHFNSNYSNIGWDAAPVYSKNPGLKVIEESSNSNANKSLTNSKKQLLMKFSQDSSSHQKPKKSNEKIKIGINKNKPSHLYIDRDPTRPDILNAANFDYPKKSKKYEPISNHRKTNSGNKEAYSQLANYSDKPQVGNKDKSSFLEYQIHRSSDTNAERKAESKHENYLDKLEENSVIDQLEEISHHDLLSYIPPALFHTIPKKDYAKLSPRSKEINTTIRIIKKSFKEGNDPPVTTTDFYKIGRMLGKGAFGKVNLGMHKLARKLVAIKSMNKQFLNDERSKRKVMQEVSIIKRTRHPNVVKLYETFESEKHVLFSMEM